MCDCVKTVNELLAQHNTKVELPWFGPQQVFVTTIKIDQKKRGNPKSMFASHCPFCGEKYPPYADPFKATETSPQP